MSTSLQSPPSTRRSALRAWFPLLAVALGAVLVTGVRLWPAEEMPRLHRNLGTLAAVGLTVLLLLVWLLFFAPLRRSRRLLILAVPLLLLAALVGGVAAGLVKVEFSGDFFVRFRFGRGSPQGVGSDAVVSATGPNDFPEYRGRQRDGVVTGPRLSTDWAATPPRKLWPLDPERGEIGAGHSGFAVAGNIAVTLEQRDDREAVVCYHAPTGKAIWIHSYPALFNELLGGEGPRSTPTIRDGEVYTLGATGTLLCLDAATGKEKWSADVLEGNANVKWGLAGSPLVLDDVVIVNPGAQTPAAPGTLAAYERKPGGTTGKRRWSAGRAPAGYSSPMLATLGGKRQVLLFDGEGVSGYDPEGGKQLWRHPWRTQEDINVAQPVLLGDDRVFISSGYGVGGAALEVKESGGAWTVKELWKNRNMACRFASPVLYEGHLYGLSEGVLTCLDAKTGERKWRGGRYGHGQVLLTDGLLLIQSEDGELALVEAAPGAYRELTRFQALEGRSWNPPALAGGLAFVRNHLQMACYDLRQPEKQ